MADRKYEFTQRYAVSEPKPGTVYLVQERDWKRIERMIREVVPYGGGFQVLWSMSAGIFGSAVFFLLSLLFAKVPAWEWTVGWVIAVSTLLVAVLSFRFDQMQKRSVSRSAETVLQEMDLLEKVYAHAAEQKIAKGAQGGPD